MAEGNGKAFDGLMWLQDHLKAIMFLVGVVVMVAYAWFNLQTCIARLELRITNIETQNTIDSQEVRSTLKEQGTTLQRLDKTMERVQAILEQHAAPYQ